MYSADIVFGTNVNTYRNLALSGRVLWSCLSRLWFSRLIVCGMIIFIALCAILFSQFVFKNKIVLKYHSQNRVVYYYSCKGRQFEGRIEVPDEGFFPKTRCIVLYFTSILFSQLQSIQPNCSSNSNSSTKVTNIKITAHLEGKCSFIGFLCKFDMFYLHIIHRENTFIHIHTYLYL